MQQVTKHHGKTGQGQDTYIYIYIFLLKKMLLEGMVITNSILSHSHNNPWVFQDTYYQNHHFTFSNHCLVSVSNNHKARPAA